MAEYKGLTALIVFFLILIFILAILILVLHVVILLIPIAIVIAIIAWLFGKQRRKPAMRVVVKKF